MFKFSPFKKQSTQEMKGCDPIVAKKCLSLNITVEDEDDPSHLENKVHQLNKQLGDSDDNDSSSELRRLNDKKIKDRHPLSFSSIESSSSSEKSLYDDANHARGQQRNRIATDSQSVSPPRSPDCRIRAAPAG
jgi:hypothetical protein